MKPGIRQTSPKIPSILSIKNTLIRIATPVATAKQGHEVYPVLFTHPANADKDWAIKSLDPKITYFTREWGDNVDDWNSHNSPSRVARNWGEQAMLIQHSTMPLPVILSPVTMYSAVLRANTSAAVCGTRSTTNAAIIPIPSMVV